MAPLPNRKMARCHASLHRPPDDPEQSKRFIDMAREVEAEGSKKDFEKAFKKIAKEKPSAKAKH
jgi:hypothetical protein